MSNSKEINSSFEGKKIKAIPLIENLKNMKLDSQSLSKICWELDIFIKNAESGQEFNGAYISAQEIDKFKEIRDRLRTREDIS